LRVEKLGKKIMVRTDIENVNNAFRRSKEGEDINDFINELSYHPNSSFYVSSSQYESSIKEEAKMVESFFHEIYKENAKNDELKCVVPKIRQDNSRDSGVFAY
ncbi:13431_t:CDS:2, partial [Ambispora gerdemannii]